jgi:hypothetical protein
MGSILLLTGMYRKMDNIRSRTNPGKLVLESEISNPIGGMMKLVKSALVLAAAPAALFLLSIKPSIATQKYAKETGKKCLDCHTKVPKKGDADHQLTELGKKFAENGHKLPKE